MGKEKDDKKKDKKDKAPKDKKDKKDKKAPKDKKDKKDKKKLSKKEKKEKKKGKKTTLVRSAYMAPSNDLVSKIKTAAAKPAPAAGSTSGSTSSAPAPSRAGVWRPGPAHEWTNAGQTSGLQIWRIEQFNVVPWPQPMYGKFYNGDSYIVLKTVVQGSVKKWDIHFWLGENTSQDEAGTAAYKTVELDEKLGGSPIEHREVQGYESPLFLSYFQPAIQILHGGIESGFNHVTPTEYKPRLLHVKGKRNIRTEQVSLDASSLNAGDVFILDGGLQIFVWHGDRSNAPERLKADQLARAIRDEREGRPQIQILTQSGQDAGKAAFWQILGGEGPIASAEEGGDDAEHEMQGTKRLMKLSDASGTLQFTEVASGRVTRNLLVSTDAFVFDCGSEVFAWVGRGASQAERSRAMAYAQQYLIQNNRPPYLPISRVFEGGENEVFNASLD